MKEPISHLNKLSLDEAKRILAEWMRDRALANAVDINPLPAHRLLPHPAPAMLSLAPVWRGW